ncbi:hypothetical protein VNO78_11261 [Psophocarpus tetragonolobus]|uniref:Uncharacterized protein n=1 Tax=Psophocarpus tetragonolobus TaxID=3891 RepID=A0AAN9SLG1_PSOTE
MSINIIIFNFTNCLFNVVTASSLMYLVDMGLAKGDGVGIVDVARGMDDRDVRGGDDDEGSVSIENFDEADKGWNKDVDGEL